MNSPIVTRRSAKLSKRQTRAMVKSNTTATSAVSTAATSSLSSFSTSGANSISSSSAAAAQGTSTTSSHSNSNSVTSRKPSAALIEAKRSARLLKIQQSMASGGGGVGNFTANTQETGIVDIFQNAVNAKNLVRKPTGLIYDTSMSKHCCLWDSKHPECPERFVRILQRCEELQLITRCHRIESRAATKDEILLLHSSEHYEKLKHTDNLASEDYLEDMSSRYDSIYLHPSTYNLSKLAVGSTIELIERIWHGEVENGMAIIRPPGHHAMKSEFNGYCFFNNVAIATKHALDVLKLSKVMIIDWDVHHGQGTQRFFYTDPRVLYFSIHRFEYGTYWPNLRESDFDAIGEGDGCGYNFNIPLNRTGMGNADYLAIFQQVLLPVALEYQPEMIIISAGYDAALGCPEGEMEVTPAFYAHLINPLLRLADSRIAVILEGGYCLESLAEGAALTLRALLGDPCPNLVENLRSPCVEIQETILNCIYVHRPHWKCLQLQQTYTIDDLNNLNPQVALHKVERLFKGGPPLPERFPTRGTAPVIPPEVTLCKMERLKNLKLHTRLITPKIRTCYAYDDFMLKHENLFDRNHPEQPKRIKKIFDMHNEYKLLERMQRVKIRVATTDEICLAHTRAHVNFIRRLTEKEKELQELGNKYNSVYFHPKTFDAATIAAGSVLNVVDNVLSGKCVNGVCIVRPPGHHAEADIPHGFCIFNNVAIAAKYALRDYGLKRVLIVDWDVHHGNGTQHIFESNSNVLYISVHRYDNGSFFPKGPDGNYDVVGKGDGTGFNVNIPWNKKGMGDLEYAMVFQQIIMPIAYEFDPELVLVSAGFDAAIGDPLGGCKVSPEAYGLFSHWLSALACGRIIICLEGGYNLHSISYAMTMCSKALLGDPVPSIQFNLQPSCPSTVTYLSCIETMQNCFAIQSRYWNSLVFNRKLPKCSDAENNNADFLTATMNKLRLSIVESQGATGGFNINEPECTEKPSGSKPKVKVKSLAEYLNEQSKELADMKIWFAVIPLRTCRHLRQLQIAEVPKLIAGSDICGKCASITENWICVSCNAIFCGRYVNEHMLHHSMDENHPLALSLSDLSVWCYSCQAYIDNRRLYKHRNVVHRFKFGEDLPWTYKSKQSTSISADTDDESSDDNNTDSDKQHNNEAAAASSNTKMHELPY